jgi:hypothetical protein
MKLPLLSALAVTLLSQVASAGVPGFNPVPVKQTFVCQADVGDSTVSVIGNLVEDPMLNALIAVTQDHIKFVEGTVDISVTPAGFNTFGGNSYFQSLSVRGQHAGGMPSFPTGQGYSLHQVDGSPLVPGIASLRISEVEEVDPATQELAQVTRATLLFDGQDVLVTVDCQSVNFDLGL